jgi:RNA polymerase sigma factor (sigma-70 family)
MTPWTLISPARLAGARLLRTQTDSRLVDLFRAGNDRAFEAIVLRHQGALLSHCRSLLPAGRAEEAVQQTLLHAFEAMRADEREIQVGPWLHRILHNTAIDSLRRLDSQWEELDEHVDRVEPTHAAAERRARFRSVVADMGSLPERQRRALVLRELEGRSYDEIAADIGVSGAGVRQLLNRARNALRAGAGALMPPALAGRMAGSKAGVTVAELADPPGTSALVAKATAAVAAGAVALLAVSAPGDRLRSPHAHARTKPPALDRRADAATRSDSRPTAAPAGPAGRRSGSHGDGPRWAVGGRSAPHGDGPRWATGHRTASHDDGPQRPAVDPGSRSRRETFGRQPADAGGGRAGGAPLERYAPPAAPPHRSASPGTVDDDPSGRSPSENLPAAPPDMEDDEDGLAGGDDGGPDDDTAAAASRPPDEGADDDAPAPAGLQVGASPAPAGLQLAANPADADEDDDEGSAGD